MKFRALLELMRVSNLPTVWSNTWMGWLAGNYAAMLTSGLGEDAPVFFENWYYLSGIGVLAALAMSLIYSGGMVMNDYIDRDVDALERPGRPIPSGRISIPAARALAVFMLLLGLACVVLTDRLSQANGAKLFLSPAVLLALGLVVIVFLYNILHQKSALTVMLMGACRSLLVLTCAALAFVPLPIHESLPKAVLAFWLVVVGVAIPAFAYTGLISAAARREADPRCRRWFDGPKTIMNMIAAMPLLDALWLVLMGLWPASLVCVGCAGLTKLGHRRIAGS
ncbi:UbiA family prenyltransferase [Phycisphaeraceae bacterium D3-23]